METTPYMLSVADDRAMLLSEEDALAGQTLLSLETCDDLQEVDVLVYVQENFEPWLRMLRRLSREQQELLLSYWILGKSQSTLCKIHRATQTVCSARLRTALATLGFFMLVGDPTGEKIRPILEGAGLENTEMEVGLSQIVAEFTGGKNFTEIAREHKIHQPLIRRHISVAGKKLRESSVPLDHGLGEWLGFLVDRVNPCGTGPSARSAKRRGDVQHRDPDILGQHRIDCADPDLDAVFTSRAQTRNPKHSQ